MQSAQELYELNLQNELLLKKVYEKELQSCLFDIRKVNNNQGKNNMVYIIPEKIITEPEYSFFNCSIYLLDRLRELGYKVHFKRPNYLHISWINHQIERENQENIKRLIDEEEKSKKVLGLLNGSNKKLLGWK